jgi:hypothetical protein
MRLPRNGSDRGLGQPVLVKPPWGARSSLPFPRAPVVLCREPVCPLKHESNQCLECGDILASVQWPNCLQRVLQPGRYGSRSWLTVLETSCIRLSNPWPWILCTLLGPTRPPLAANNLPLSYACLSHTRGAVSSHVQLLGTQTKKRGTLAGFVEILVLAIFVMSGAHNRGKFAIISRPSGRGAIPNCVDELLDSSYSTPIMLLTLHILFTLLL